MFICRDVNATIIRTEIHQVQRGQVTGGIVKEHIFRARVGRIDATRIRAGVPFVDGGVVLDTRIGARPCGFADLVPQFAGGKGFMNLAIGTADQFPVAIIKNSLKEVVRDANRVVRVLTRNGQVCLGVPIGVIGLEADFGEALTGEFDDLVDIAVGDHHRTGGQHGFFELRVGTRQEAILGIGGTVPVGAGSQNIGQVLFGQFRTGDEGRDLLFFDDFPVDIVFDVRVVDINHDHLGRTARGAARLDRTSSTVTDFKEAHEAGRTAATRKRFAFAADIREVRTGARTEFEQAGFAGPEIHDAALVDEVIGNRLDEAGMGLRMFVRAGRFGQFAGFEINIGVTLRRAINAVGPMQTGIEPLRRVRRAHLVGELITHFIKEGLGIGFGIEIAAFPAPIGPGARKAVKDLGGAGFAGVAGL